MQDLLDPSFTAVADSASASPSWGRAASLNSLVELVCLLLNADHFQVTLAMAASNGAFVPALIVVDMQEDFCPPVSLENSWLQTLPAAGPC